LRIAAGKKPSVLNEKAAAQRVKGLSQAVAFRNSFCSALFMYYILLDGPPRFLILAALAVLDLTSTIVELMESWPW
jgi:hypothetical protein